MFEIKNPRFLRELKNFLKDKSGLSGKRWDSTFHGPLHG
jgi:hypothetical protein